MATVVVENSYKFSVKTGKQEQIAHTNGTTRTLLHRELVVHTDANGKTFLGFVASPAGIAASATGMIDLFEEQEVTTNQFTAASFVAGDVGVFVLAQTNSAAALIKQATAEGLYPLDALIISYGASTTLRLRMPVQLGTAVAVPAE